MKLEHCMSLWLAALMALPIAGCEANRYEIEMRPAGESVERELTCWRERTANDKTVVAAFPEEELEKIAAAYDAPVPGEKASKHKFASVFAGKMPNDLGGSGSYTHWNTSLGSVSAYVERVRGNDDLLDDVEARQEAADRIADLPKRLRTFRFSHEPPASEGDESDSDLAATARELILGSLTGDAAAN